MEARITILRDRMAELRPLFRPPDPCQRTFYLPGELAQWDLWQPDALIPVGFGRADKLWVVTSAAGFSRFIGGWMVPSRAAHDVLMWQVLGQFGAEPRHAVTSDPSRRDTHLSFSALRPPRTADVVVLTDSGPAPRAQTQRARRDSNPQPSDP